MPLEGCERTCLASPKDGWTRLNDTRFSGSSSTVGLLQPVYLLNPNTQDLRAGGGDLCGAFANANFGTSVFSNTIDPDVLNGWGVRPSDWDLSVGV